MAQSNSLKRRLRVCRYRPYKNSVWNSKYLPSIFLGSILENGPDVLNRYFDGPVNLDDPELVQFFQDSLNRLSTYERENVRCYPRLTLNYFNYFLNNIDTWKNVCQNLFDLGQRVVPKQTGIAFDNENVINSYQDALKAIQVARDVGFTDICFGAIGAKFQGQWKNGDVDFVMLGVNTSNWTIDAKLVDYWQSFSSVKRIIAQIDPPLEYEVYQKLSYEEKVTALTSLAEQQSLLNCSFMYMIEQEQCDSWLEGTYYDIKTLMETYN